MPSIHTPYRVCPLGAHVDHQHGPVSGFALNKGITLTYEPMSHGKILLTSRNFSGTVDTTVHSVTDRDMHWGDYVRSAVAALLNAKYELFVGIQGEIEGTLPIGGLSSSASVIITYIRAICALNGISLTQEQLIRLAHWAETRYIGLNNGLLDQSCEVYGRKDCLLFLDTLDSSYELIPRSGKMPPFEIMIVFSGITRALINSAYNARVDECKAAAYALKACSGMPYEKIADTRLRDVRREIFEAHQDKLPEAWRKRARHYYTEVERVRTGVEAWRAGDMSAFGKAIFESGTSSIENYEAGAPELIALHKIALHADGVYGSRFSGAGFKGCYMALIDPSCKDRLVLKFTDEYLRQFPDLKDRFSIHFCHSADGAGCQNDLMDSEANTIQESCI
ncbi:MAG: GHMP kinase [Clostridiales bacterium]|nr:GHMP kinase [Clostridiales bacterium]